MSLALTPQRGGLDRLGRYQLDRELATGGMGRLFVARTGGVGGFEKRVALKQLLPELAEDPELVERFLQEARLVATFDHPNVVGVFDVGEQDGAYYFAMEYVDGADLRRLISAAKRSKRAFDPVEAASIGRSICAALHYAHEKRDAAGRPLRLVHRDVSPSNILISRAGAVKLTDFGIAKISASVVSTRGDTLRGKIPYMSPEQASGEPLTHRSDIYSLGLVLFELLAGRRAIADDNEIAMLRAAQRDAVPDVREQRPECPAALARIVATATARDSPDRYASAQDMGDALERFARGHGATGQRTAIDTLVAELVEQRSTEVPQTAVAGPSTLGEDNKPTATVSADALGVVPPRRPARGRRWAIAVGVVGLLALGAGAWAQSAEAPTPTAAAAPTSAPAAAEPTPPPAQPAPVATAASEAEVQAGGRVSTEPEPSPRPSPKARRPRRSKRATKRKAKAPDLDAALPPGFEL